jgi:hypothetical protein
MRTQLQVLGWLHFVTHVLYVVGGVAILFLGSAIAAAVAAAGGHELMPLAAFLAAGGSVFAAILICIGLPGTVIGWALAHQAPWARIPGIILSILCLPAVPVGTAIGVYGLVVLFHPDVEAHLDRRALESA